MKKQNNKTKMYLAGAALAAVALGAAGAEAHAAGIGNAAFSDENFYACVVKQYNELFPGSVTVASNPSETVLTDAQLAKINILDCDFGTTGEGYSNLESHYDADVSINNVAGLEKLTGVEQLLISGHRNLTEVDLSQNTKLVRLGLHTNNLTTLDLSHNPSLKYINIGGNKLNGLDLSKQTEVLWLQASHNQLTELDLSHNVKLKTLEIVDNAIKNLDLSHNQNLRALFADNMLVTPYAEYGFDDDCNLTVKLNFVGEYNTILPTDDFEFDDASQILTIKKLPEVQAASTIEVLSAYKTSSATYRLIFDDMEEEYTKANTCKVKPGEGDENDEQAADGEIDDKAEAGAGVVKSPDTGAYTGDSEGNKFIGLPVGMLAGAALAIASAAYVLHRVICRRRFYK